MEERITFVEYARAYLRAKDLDGGQELAKFLGAEFFPRNEYGHGWYPSWSYYKESEGRYYKYRMTW